MRGVDGLYRVATTASEAPRDRGIVGDVIGQFADPFAFYRELVQNAIDAGTPRVDVHLEREADAAVVRASVRDHGEGMTRDIIENQLLVLFRSTKENDDTKIGKFGIGFASVLSPAPNLVVVTTSRDGRRLTLHLKRDLSYELFDAGPATKTGTSVELEIPLTDTFEAFVAASEEALVRWCRHASVPVHVVAVDSGATVREVRVDRPLALDHALVQVQAVSDDQLTTVVVGITEDAAPYAGFFDHGLTLFEDAAPLLGRIAFKVQDARLAHTISRDNVRRDAAFDRAVAFADDVAARRLPAACATALREAAEAVNRARYATLCAVIATAEIPISRGAWSFPLVEPVAGARAVSGEDLGSRLLSARYRSAITAQLAAAGVPVIDFGGHGELANAVHTRVGEPMPDVHRELTRVCPIAPTPLDDALLALVGKLLATAHRKPSGLSLATLEGALADRLAITGERDDAVHEPRDDDDDDDGDGGPLRPWLVERRRAGRKAFGLLSRAPLILSAEHAAVVAARRRADTEPVAAASLLARLLLLDAGELDATRSERLLDATLAALGLEVHA
jgi:molecular chaperone HtpG